MIVAIHQPNYLPYLGFFDKMNKSDIFVIYDDAQFNKEEFQHRNRIRISQGWKYLTVPVEKKRIPISNIKIRNEHLMKGLTWQKTHMKDILDNYKMATHFENYRNIIEAIYAEKYDLLVDLNMNFINFLKDAFDIKTKIIFSSELGLTSKSTEKLVDITEVLGGNTYLSGPSGRNYLDISLFKAKNINLEFQDYKYSIYKQCYKGFIPNLSAIDSLFNVRMML